MPTNSTTRGFTVGFTLVAVVAVAFVAGLGLFQNGGSLVETWTALTVLMTVVALAAIAQNRMQ